MSAPFEVNLCSECIEDALACALHSKGQERKTRYLRADLTCGECGEYQTRKCAHLLGHPSSPMLMRPDKSAVACMAFVPRKEQL